MWTEDTLNLTKTKDLQKIKYDAQGCGLSLWKLRVRVGPETKQGPQGLALSAKQPGAFKNLSCR